jgi:hypothetical protein
VIRLFKFDMSKLHARKAEDVFLVEVHFDSGGQKVFVDPVPRLTLKTEDETAVNIIGLERETDSLKNAFTYNCTVII